MRAEKKLIGRDYLSRLNSCPFFIVIDYQTLKVSHFGELRKRLGKVGAEVHVVKNTIFRVSAKEAGLPDFGKDLVGQLAVVTGQKDVSSTAKILKTFKAEFDRPKVRFGFLSSQRLEASDLAVLADLPSIEVLRGQLLGVIQTPASQLARLIATPGTQVARVVQAWVDLAGGQQ